MQFIRSGDSQSSNRNDDFHITSTAETFGQIPLGSTGRIDFTITNISEYEIEITEANISIGSIFTIEGFENAVILTPDESHSFSIVATPIELGHFSGSLTIIYDYIEEHVTFTINSTEQFLNEMQTIITAANTPHTSVMVNVNSISVSEAQLPLLTSGVNGLGQNVQLNWTTMYPTAQGILFRYQEDWHSLRTPPLHSYPYF